MIIHKPKRLPAGERHYLALMRAGIAAERRRGEFAPGGQLGDLAGPVDDLFNSATSAIRGQLEELRRGLTISSAASVAAAVGVVLLLLRTGSQGHRGRRSR